MTVRVTQEALMAVDFIHTKMETIQVVFNHPVPFLGKFIRVVEIFCKLHKLRWKTDQSQAKYWQLLNILKSGSNFKRGLRVSNSKTEYSIWNWTRTNLGSRVCRLVIKMKLSSVVFVLVIRKNVYGFGHNLHSNICFIHFVSNKSLMLFFRKRIKPWDKHPFIFR